MMKCGSEKTAQAFASERNEHYGQSVFGGWFVGTREALLAIGIVNPLKP